MTGTDVTTSRTVARVLEVPTLDGWADAWDALADRLPLPTPFLSTWWMSGVGGPSDRYVLVVEGERLLGGLALQHRRRLGVDLYEVQGGGKLCPDHLDLVADPDRVDDVVTALRSWFEAPGARLLDLVGLREDPVVGRVLAGRDRVDLVDVAPYEPLSTDPDAYLEGRSKGFRRSYRKFARRLDETGVVVRRVADAEVAGAMEVFAALHRAREDRTELSRELPRLLRAVERGAAAGRIQVHVAELDDRVGAVLLLFVAGDRLCVYQTARLVEDRDFNHVGTVIDVLAIEAAAAAGTSEIDFLRGTERYKRSFTAHERRLLRHRAAHGLRGRLALALSVLADAARRRAGSARRAVRARLDRAS